MKRNKHKNPFPKRKLLPNKKKGTDMGHFSNYLSKKLSFEDMEKERKILLKEISTLRGNRDIFVYASDLTKNAAISIDYNDILPFQDQ